MTKTLIKTATKKTGNAQNVNEQTVPGNMSVATAPEILNNMATEPIMGREEQDSIRMIAMTSWRFLTRWNGASEIRQM